MERGDMSINSKMTALADEIRELSGTTSTKSIDAMTTDIGAANTEINEQSDLIAQITAALETKSGASNDIFMSIIERSATHIDVPNGTTKIGRHAFYNFQTLKTVSIPEGVTSIDGGAFNSCSYLQNLVIPSSVSTIGAGALAWCSRCKVFDFSSHKTIPTIEADTFTGAFNGTNANAKILVPYDLYSSWIYATNWSVYRPNIVDYYSVNLGDTSGEYRYALSDLNISTNYNYLPSGSGEPKAYYSYDGGVTATEITYTSAVNASDLTFSSFYDEGASNIWDWNFSGSYMYFWGNDLDIWVEVDGKTVYERHYVSTVA